MAADLSKRDAQGLSSRGARGLHRERIRPTGSERDTDWVYQTTAKPAVALAEPEKARDLQTDLQHRLDSALANAARAAPLEQTVMALRTRLAAYESSPKDKSPSDKPATAV
jgi:hypothetical protein